MITFVRPESKYIPSFWQAFDTIAKEGKYLAALEAFPIESTVELVNQVIEENIPQLFAIDTELDICVGWCDALPKDETGSAGYIGTGLLKEYREKGFGSKMLEEIIALSRAYGYQRLELDVRASNQRAIHVYEKLGFTICNRVQDGFTLLGHTVAEDVVQMELSL